MRRVIPPSVDFSGLERHWLLLLRDRLPLSVQAEESRLRRDAEASRANAHPSDQGAGQEGCTMHPVRTAPLSPDMIAVQVGGARLRVPGQPAGFSLALFPGAEPRNPRLARTNKLAAVGR